MGEDGYAVAIKRIGRKRAVAEMFTTAYRSMTPVRLLQLANVSRLGAGFTYAVGLTLLLEKSGSIEALVSECKSRALPHIAGRWYGHVVFVGGDYAKQNGRDVFEDVVHAAGTHETVFIDITPAVLTAILELVECAREFIDNSDALLSEIRRELNITREYVPCTSVPKYFCKRYGLYCGIEDLVCTAFKMGMLKH